MKKFFRFSLLLAIVAMLAGTVAPAFAQDPTATPFEPVPSEEGVLTIWINLERVAVIEEIGKEFEAKYGVPVRIQTMGFGDVRNNFNIAAPAGEGPDIIIGAHDWIGQLYSNGLLAPIELSDELKAKFDPVSLDGFTYEGKLVGLPYQTEAVAVYYNKDLMPDGVPATWAETVDLAKKLVADGKAEAGLGLNPDYYHNHALFTGFGGGVFGRDEVGAYDPKNVLLDSEGSIAAAAELDRLVKEGVLKDGLGYDQLRDLFKSGKLAMWVTGPWALLDIRTTDIKFGVAPIPMMKQTPKPFVGVQGFMVNALSKNLLLAQAFLTEFIATDENMIKIIKAQPGIPAFTPIIAEVADADIQGFAASVANGEPMPAIPEMSAVWNSVGSAITLIIQQKEAPDKVMTDAAKAIRDEIAKSK